MNEVKKIAFIFLLGMIITIIVLLVNYKNASINNNGHNSISNYKYDINKTVSELNLNTVGDYLLYLNDLKNQIEITAIKELVNIDEVRAKRYKNASITQKRKGRDIINGLVSNAYQDLIEIVIQKNEKWDKLPLTEHFKSKFNEKYGCIKEIDSDKIYVHNFGYSDDNKTFSIEYSYIPDDAYEKYPAEQIEFMLEYGAGAYNLDYYNYQYVLDDEGYLDDIIFLGITPHIVEGRYVDEDE